LGGEIGGSVWRPVLVRLRTPDQEALVPRRTIARLLLDQLTAIRWNLSAANAATVVDSNLKDLVDTFFDSKPFLAPETQRAFFLSKDSQTPFVAALIAGRDAASAESATLDSGALQIGCSHALLSSVQLAWAMPALDGDDGPRFPLDAARHISDAMRTSDPAHIALRRLAAPDLAAMERAHATAELFGYWFAEAGGSGVFVTEGCVDALATLERYWATTTDPEDRSRIAQSAHQWCMRLPALGGHASAWALRLVTQGTHAPFIPRVYR
jgi:hypothetical protein